MHSNVDKPVGTSPSRIRGIDVEGLHVVGAKQPAPGSLVDKPPPPSTHRSIVARRSRFASAICRRTTRPGEGDFEEKTTKYFAFHRFCKEKLIEFERVGSPCGIVKLGRGYCPPTNN